jgi:hypothetical protein
VYPGIPYALSCMLMGFARRFTWQVIMIDVHLRQLTRCRQFA